MSYELRDVTPEEWLHAMEHDYTQSRGVLMRDHDGVRGFCCLGVLCHLRGYPEDELERRGTWPGSVQNAAWANAILHPDYDKFDAYPDWLVDMAVDRGMLTDAEVNEEVDRHAPADRQRHQLRALVLQKLMDWNDESTTGFPLEQLVEFYGPEEQA